MSRRMVHVNLTGVIYAGMEDKPENGEKMENATVKEMLQAGLHFGHQTRRWNPKMKPYIYGPRNGIYIINLDMTKRLFDRACDFVANEVARGGECSLCRDKKAGPGNNQRRSQALQYVLYRP